VDFNQIFKDISQRISSILPANMQILKADLEKNVQSILTSTFAKLDLVTREEFDTQTKVLARTRQKVQALEAKIIELEKSRQDNSHGE
jgi:ubiquinone biosynthesis accessory factor UbiK